VIKMPQGGGPGEERERMAFMEYAIAGLLVHDNIVQTYQADIRPVFLEDDANDAKSVSKSSWTGLGEFLSNETISQQMHRSMRIQEWELRLVMEYCSRGARRAVASSRQWEQSCGNSQSLPCCAGRASRLQTPHQVPPAMMVRTIAVCAQGI
jgi:hypothetical protein